MKITQTNPPTSFLHSGLTGNLFFPDVQYTIMSIYPYQHAGNVDQENVEQLRQGCYCVYEEIIPLDVYVYYTVVAEYLKRFNEEEIIGRIRVLSRYQK